MRKLQLLTLLIIIFLGGCSVFSPKEKETALPKYHTYKDIPSVTRDEVEAIERLLTRRPRLVYGFCSSTEAFLREDGSVGGFAELFTNRLSELFGFEFDYSPVSWGEMTEKIASKEIDIVSDFTATPERLQKFLMTDAILQRAIKIFTNAGVDSLNVTAKTRPIRCAFMEGSITYSLVEDSWNIPFEPVFIADQSEVPNMMLNGEIDAFIEEGTLEAAFDVYDFIQTEEYYPLIYSPISLTTGNSEMAPVINVMRKYLTSGGYYELTELYKRGYKDYLKHKLLKRLTEEEKAYIQGHRDEGTAILMACEVDNYPTSFYNEEENKFQGMALDTLHKISDLTGLTFQVGNAPNALWSELIDGLESGKYSIISELLRSGQREGRFIWADRPYCTSNYAMLSKAEYPDIDINQVLFAKVGLLKGAAHTDVFLEWFPYRAKTAQYYNSNDDAFAALVKGEIDLLMASQNMLLNLTNYQEKPGFKANLVFKYSSDSFFGFNKDEEILRSIVNKALRYANVEEITGHWQRKIFNYESKMIRDALPFIVLFVALLVVAFFVVFLFYIKNRQINKNLEKLVSERTKELQGAIEAAKNANKAKGDFLARMSHEIRTPLNAIIGLSEVEMRNDLPKDTQGNLEKIYDSGSNLLSIVNDILDISKIESGNFELVPVKYNISNLISDTVQLNIIRIGSKPVTFDLLLDETIPNHLCGDEMRIKQVLNNLLSNAFKYTKEGRVALELEWERNNNDAWLIFTVSDTGQGIKKENIEKLYSEYYRADSQENRYIEGTGLGLSITKNLAELMDGGIEVESEYGKGSTFRVKIRQEIVEAAPIGSETAEKLRRFHFLDNRSARGKKLVRTQMPYGKVLLVDDVQANLDVAKGLMMPYKLRIDCVLSGQEAIDVIRAIPDDAPAFEKYDIIFMDHMMPEVDGIEAARVIRGEIGTDYARTVPIIALTANALKGNDAMFLSHGFDAFISKPIDIIQLDTALNRWVRDRHSEKTPPQKGQTAPDDPAVFSTLDGRWVENVNLKAGLELYEDEEIYLQVLNSFVTHTPESLEKMREVSSEALAEYAIIVHGLKGASGGICAEAIAGQAEILESAAKSGDFETILAKNGVFIETFETLLSALSDLLRDVPANLFEDN
ncbi:MAG: transporter substrate-binding domain-containing protein [Synergistaceae bacterium]|jgi:signal transduction histidine kinase/CheY-like chemotaxis protein/HPt (histidine-containing phosphotransfer) domain-containing protein|nr:transporter substrate-binding domain-containing protein [Synergistaceae bacterium]